MSLVENQEILEGRFKIIKKLGSGAFGEIFKGKFIASVLISLGTNHFFLSYFKNHFADRDSLNFL